jgi:hypothetical protein
MIAKEKVTDEILKIRHCVDVNYINEKLKEYKTADEENNL